MDKYSDLLQFRPIYEYPIKYIHFNPPLIYNKQEDFIAIGLWGTLTQGKPEDLFNLEKEFMGISLKNNYKRYIQSELKNPQTNYKEYFPPEIFTEFKKLKDKYDPDSIINSGVF